MNGLLRHSKTHRERMRQAARRCAEVERKFRIYTEAKARLHAGRTYAEKRLRAGCTIHFGGSL